MRELVTRIHAIAHDTCPHTSRSCTAAPHPQPRPEGAEGNVGQLPAPKSNAVVHARAGKGVEAAAPNPASDAVKRECTGAIWAQNFMALSVAEKVNAIRDGRCYAIVKATDIEYSRVTRPIAQALTATAQKVMSNAFRQRCAAIGGEPVRAASDGLVSGHQIFVALSQASALPWTRARKTWSSQTHMR